MTAFCNTEVDVKPNSEGGIDVKLTPSITYVTTTNTVLNYTFSATTSPDYIFEGITNVQGLEGQFSAPSVAVDGRMMTFSDWNSVNGTINFSLQIANRSSGARHLHDPEVVNTGH